MCVAWRKGVVGLSERRVLFVFNRVRKAVLNIPSESGPAVPCVYPLRGMGVDARREYSYQLACFVLHRYFNCTFSFLWTKLARGGLPTACA